MKRITSLLVFVAALSCYAQTSSFTYQGRLSDGNAAANGNYDLQFVLRDAASAGNPVGSALTNAPVSVTNGLFTVTLDFGAGMFTGANRWLEIGVRTNGSASTFTILSPPQQVTSTPYAIYSANAASASTVAPASVGTLELQTGSVTATKIPTGQVVKSLNGLFDAVALAAGPNIGLSTNGNTLTISGGASGGGGWSLTGSAGTTPAVNYLGTSDFQPLELRVWAQRAFRLEPTGSEPNIIGGSSFNRVSNSFGVAIGGGYSNQVFWANNTHIGGGKLNMIFSGSTAAAISGGSGNWIQTNSPQAFIGAGTSNFIGDLSDSAFIGGGNNNGIQLNSLSATIGGGTSNFIGNYTDYAFIGGGYKNAILETSREATIGGGVLNGIQIDATAAVIAGGFTNFIGSYSHESSIGGGDRNAIQDNTTIATISGGEGNKIFQGASGAAISGGLLNSIQYYCLQAFIGGGQNNAIQTNSAYSVIGGGAGNVIDTNSYIKYVYAGNIVRSVNGGFSTVTGGAGNTISSGAAFIGGGNINLVDTNSDFAVIAGGQGNSISTNGIHSVIGGGRANSISSPQSTVAGGYANVITTNYGATIGGGNQNTANGRLATIPGGFYNRADGTCSFAAGSNAKAFHDYSFVWAGGGVGQTTAAGQFVILAPGGMSIFKNNPAAGTLDVGGPIRTDSSIMASSSVTATSFVQSSDRNAKEKLKAVDPRSILERVAGLPISSWSFKQDSASRHIGPMAQDFYAAFNLGADDKHITTVDEGGVALAAIQGLHQIVMEKDAKISALESQNDQLEKRLSQLERVVNSLAERK